MVLNEFLSLFIIVFVSMASMLIARALRVPRVLVFLCVGLGAQVLQASGLLALDFSIELLQALVVGTLVFSVLDHAVQLNLHEWSSFIHGFAQFTVIRLVFSVCLLALLAYFSQSLVLPAILIGLLVCAGAPEVLRRKHSQEDTLLNIDAIVSSSLSIAGVFLLLAASQGFSVFSSVRDSVTGFFVVIATGFFLGLLFYRLVLKCAEPWARVAVFVLGIVAFVLGEKFAPGLGVLASLSLGLLFANVKLPHDLLHEPFVSGIAEGIVFILLGLLIPFSQSVWLAGVIIFIVLMVGRYLAVLFTQPSMHKAIVCLSNPVGMPTAATALYLLIIMPSLSQFLVAIPSIVFISLVLHTIVNYPLQD